MGELGLITLIMIIIAVVGILLLFLIKKPNMHTIIFIIMACFGLIIGIIGFTAEPSNAILEKIVALIFGICSIVSLLVHFGSKRYQTAANILVCISIIGGFLAIYF